MNSHGYKKLPKVNFELIIFVDHIELPSNIGLDGYYITNQKTVLDISQFDIY